MWSAYNKDTKSSWRRQYVGRRASCQRFNLKRDELLAVINVSYGEHKSRWRKFLFHNSTVTSHIKRTSYKKKRMGARYRRPKIKDQDTRRMIKIGGSYRNSTTHVWVAGNPRVRGAKCWGSKLITAQGLTKNNTLGHPVMKKGKERRKGWEVQRIGIQRSMKGKDFKFHEVKERPSRSKSVSQKEAEWGELGWDPRECQSPRIPRTHNTAQIRS